MFASGGASLDLSLVVFMMFMMFVTMLLLALRCVPTDVPTSAKTMSCRFYSCSFGLRPLVACQGDSEPSLGSVHWWSNCADNAKVMGSFPLVATKKKKKHGKTNLPNECLVTAVQWLVLLVPTGELQPSA